MELAPMDWLDLEHITPTSNVIIEPGPATFVWMTEAEVEADDKVFTLKSDYSSEIDIPLIADESLKLENSEIHEGEEIFSWKDLDENFKASDLEKLENFEAEATEMETDDPPESTPTPATLSSPRNESNFCSLCVNVSFGDAKEAIEHMLAKHMRTHGAMCTLCHTKLSHGHSLRKHIKGVHFRLDEFECPYCSEIIQQRSHLNRHISSVHKGKKLLTGSETTFQCTDCHRRFFKVERRERHIKEDHTMNGDNSRFTCPECSKVCSTRLHFDLHLAQHSKENISVGYNSQLSDDDELMQGKDRDCKICGKELDSLEAKKLHMRAVHQNMRPFNCGLCDQRFWSSLHLKAHLRLHTNEQSIGRRKDDIVCDYCNQKFDSNQKLLGHVEELHAYQCPECPRHLQTTSGLAKHYKKAHIKKDLICCVKCGLCFKTKDELGVHAEKKHNKMRQKQQYSLLKQPVSSSSLLLKNQTPPSSLKKLSPDNNLNVPSQVKIKLPGSCQYCSFSLTFRNQRQFDEHVQDCHPFKCPLCSNKMVKYPTSIRKHFRSYHPSVRPLFCRSCTMVFTKEKDQHNHSNCLHNRSKESGDRGSTETSLAKSQLDVGKFDLFIPDENDVIEEIISYESLAEDDDPEDVAVQSEEEAEEEEEDKDVDADKADAKEECEKSDADSDSEEEVSKCKHCEEDFDTDQDLLEHIEENHPFDCPICHRPLKNQDSLRKHCRSLHDGILVSGCKWCVIPFLDPENKKRHMRSVHQRASHKAQQQNVSQTNGGVHNDHIQKPVDNGVLEEPLGGFTCPDCSREYNVADSLRKHCKTIHDRQVFTCGPCQLTFLNAETKRQHTESHSQKTSSNNDSLSVSDNSGLDVTYNCPLCERNYEIGSSLRKHSRKIHNQAIALCRFCTMVFMSVKERDAHMEESHQREQKNFTSTGQSNILRRLATPPPPQKRNSDSSADFQTNYCDICQTDLQNSDSFQNHMEEWHPFKCPNCPKRYKLSKSLRKHFRADHGQKSLHICHSCAKAFVSEKDFNSHKDLDNCSEEEQKLLSNSSSPRKKINLSEKESNCFKQEEKEEEEDPILRSDSPMFHGFNQSDESLATSRNNSAKKFRQELDEFEKGQNATHFM